MIPMSIILLNTPVRSSSGGGAFSRTLNPIQPYTEPYSVIH